MQAIAKTQGEMDKAIVDHSRAIELNPKDAAPFASRGFALMGLGRGAEAERDFERARKLDSRMAEKIAAQVEKVKKDPPLR